jgi:hypothetical protein
MGTSSSHILGKESDDRTMFYRVKIFFVKVINRRGCDFTISGRLVERPSPPFIPSPTVNEF